MPVVVGTLAELKKEGRIRYWLRLKSEGQSPDKLKVLQADIERECGRRPGLRWMPIGRNVAEPGRSNWIA